MDSNDMERKSFGNIDQILDMWETSWLLEIFIIDALYEVTV